MIFMQPTSRMFPPVKLVADIIVYLQRPSTEIVQETSSNNGRGMAQLIAQQVARVRVGDRG